jgi:hypothetical protein
MDEVNVETVCWDCGCGMGVESMELNEVVTEEIGKLIYGT